MISDKAVIHPNAKIGPNVSIGPFTVIGPDVEIGAGCWIGPHVVINGPTRLGKDNKIFQFASIGEAPQDKKYDGEETWLIVGDGNIFRECTTVTRGTVKGGAKTVIGNHNLFMAYVHIAHDCMIGNETVFSNNASLAGHVRVEDFANLSGFVGVHQFCSIGRYSFCAGGSIIVKDVPPFITVQGYPASVHGLNSEGLKRRQFDSETLSQLKRAYRALYREGLTLEEALVKLEEMVLECPPVQLLIDFIKASERGIIR
ncbi:MAG: acyl-ACP--UDP-N-acetylglucosamine O-acyltransferase [Gammaproteobacteria bacterium]